MSSVLDQTVLPSEIVLVKDGKLTPELDETIEKYAKAHPNLFKIVALKKNVGLGLALKEGIQHCSNELIARMDSDDFIVPERCAKQLAVFRDSPYYDCVGSFEAEFEDDLDNVIAIHKVPESEKEIEKFMRRRCALLHPTVMFRKSAVLVAGNYRSVILYEDYDLFMRMVLEHGSKCYNIQEPLYYIRVNSDFYKRRGGLKYMQTVLKFKNAQRKKGYMSSTDFIISAGGQAVICLLPNEIRKWFYLKFLR